MRSYGKLMEGVNTPVKKESGDLISRKELLKHLSNWQMESFAEVGHEREYNLLDMIIRGVENQPCAYNVDKVVEQLQETNKNLCNHIICCKEKHCDICTVDNFLSEQIEIVRKGGVE